MKNNPSTNTEFWDRHRGTIRSRKGGWKIGDGIFCHGYNILEDLVGDKSYFQLMVLNATGKLIDKKVSSWLEAVFMCLSWPDPRIWCNQIGALGGTMRASAVASTTSGILAGDSKLYAQKTLLEGMRFIQEALKLKIKGFSATDIVKNECKKHRGKPIIMGYARPIAKGDERVEALERYSKKLGMVTEDHLQLAYEIDRIMSEEYGESINIGGYVNAIFSDCGFTPQEAYQFAVTTVASGVTACYVDTFERPPESFLPLRCDDIDYQGPPPREVPDRED